MGNTRCVALVLAGGRGERLGALTRYYPKPAVHFGARHRIIDFTLRNCVDSNVGSIGVLSQYFSGDLHAYIRTVYGKAGSDGAYMLPPAVGSDSYSGTADAVYKNIAFVERFRPKHVLVLAGDHIYKMDYRKMLEFHEKSGACVTVASTPVPLKEAGRFGILSADTTGRVYDFEEKPSLPKSNLASMGIYVFQWDALRRYLISDGERRQSCHDFGKNILPAMLGAGEAMYTYGFDGYWRDVGTIESLWQANMDQLDRPDAPAFPGPRPDNLMERVSEHGNTRQSLISSGCYIRGRVRHSVLGARVTVGKGAEIVDSVIMPGAYIGENVRLNKTVVGASAVIMDGVTIGEGEGSQVCVDGNICANGVSLVAPWLRIEEGLSFREGSHIEKERLRELDSRIRREAGACCDPAERELLERSMRQDLLAYR